MNSKTKTLITGLLVTAAFSLPIPVMADTPEDIRARVKKVGEINMSAETAAVAAPATETAPSEAPAPAAETAAAGDTAAAAADLYQSGCFACHGTGAAGAPILGDQAAWQPRIAKGEAVLVDSAINGLNGVMPPRGASSLNDDELKAVVAYMIESSQ